MKKAFLPEIQQKSGGTLLFLLGCYGAGLALLLLAVFGILSPNTMRYLLQILLYISLGEAWNLLSGYAGLTSLGQQLYIGLAGYSVAIATSLWKWPIGGGLFLGVVLCGAAALVLSLFLFRVNGMYFAVATWVAAEAVSVFFLSWKFVNQGGGMIITASPYPSTYQMYLIALLLCVVTLTVVVLTLHSRLGFALLAIRDDPVTASAIGINTRSAKLAAYFISSMLMGLAGGVFIVNKGVIYPDAGFHISWTVSLVFIVIIGGTGTVTGPMVGSVIYVLLREYLAHYPGWSNIMLGFVTILVILFLPRGIVGTIKERVHGSLFSSWRAPGSLSEDPLSDRVFNRSMKEKKEGRVH